MRDELPQSGKAPVSQHSEAHRFVAGSPSNSSVEVLTENE